MIKKILIFIVMASMLMGCRSALDPKKEIVGKTYILEEKIVVGDEGHEILVTLNFEHDRLNGKFLNNYNSSYKVEGDIITISPMATTLMAGPEELMKKETQYFSDLTSANKISIDEDILTITTVQGKELVFRRNK